MKALARSYMWWRGMDNDVEDMVRRCSACQEHARSPTHAPIHPWEWPTQPWMRIHADYGRPVMGQMLLIIIDAHSKWIEVCTSSSATAAVTVRHMRGVFAQHGLPHTLVTDNGPAFVIISEEFEQFLSANGIQHVKTAPYHPASNGLAEKAVGIVKTAIAKGKGSLDERIAKALLAYHVTPHTTTGVAPSELLLGRRIRTRLDLLQSSLGNTVTQRQLRQKYYSDRHCRHGGSSFAAGDTVYMRNWPGLKPVWIPAVLERAVGPQTFQCVTSCGRQLRRHVDNLRPRVSTRQAEGRIMREAEATEVTDNGPMSSEVRDSGLKFSDRLPHSAEPEVEEESFPDEGVEQRRRDSREGKESQREEMSSDAAAELESVAAAADQSEQERSLGRCESEQQTHRDNVDEVPLRRSECLRKAPIRLNLQGGRSVM